jgi:hypothetical protein
MPVGFVGRLAPGAVIVALLSAAGCGADPGRDVQPMAPPLAGAATTALPDLEIIPIDEVRKSQAAAVSQRVANTDITVTYSRPVARGRPLFGALVPYDEVWNPGADQATAVAFSRDVVLHGHALGAGKYSLWCVPRADRWTVIFSRAADVYHTPYPGEADDALRFEVVQTSGPHAEALTFSFPTVDGKSAVLQLHWGTVVIPIEVNVP